MPECSISPSISFVYSFAPSEDRSEIVDREVFSINFRRCLADKSLMSTCVVPGCINLLQEWMTWFPRAARLANRWVSAIEVGTGQQVPQFRSQYAQICNMHFAVSPDQSNEVDVNAYREPTLFFR